MRLKYNSEKDKVILKIYTTPSRKGDSDIKGMKEEQQTIELPSRNIHYWYPFLVNYYYRFSEERRYMYIAKDSGCLEDLESDYIPYGLRRATKLKKVDGVPYHEEVYSYNKEVINMAKKLGVPTIEEEYTHNDLCNAFLDIGDMMDSVRDRIRDRLEEKAILESHNDLFSFIDDTSEQIYNSATKEEVLTLRMLGSIYTMLTVMRKLLGGK